MHRAKSGRNFAIGAGYLFIFLRPDGARVVFFLPRAPIGFRAGQKKMLTRSLTRLLTRFLTRLLPSIAQIYMLKSNFSSYTIVPLVLTLRALNVFFSALALAYISIFYVPPPLGYLRQKKLTLTFFQPNMPTKKCQSQPFLHGEMGVRIITHRSKRTPSREWKNQKLN